MNKREKLILFHTFTPCSARCEAADRPAKPAPTIMTLNLFFIADIMHSLKKFHDSNNCFYLWILRSIVSNCLADYRKYVTPLIYLGIPLSGFLINIKFIIYDVWWITYVYLIYHYPEQDLYNCRIYLSLCWRFCNDSGQTVLFSIYSQGLTWYKK